MKIKELFIKSSNFFPFSTELLIRLSRKNVIFPFYHSVSDNPSVFIKNLYSEKSTLEFENDLEFLLKYFKPINASDLLSLNFDDLKSSDNYFLLSFDDGLRSYYKNAVPILKKHRVTAVNFLNTKFINNQFLFFRYKASVLIEELVNYSFEMYDSDSICNIINKETINTEQLIQWLLNCSIKDDSSLDKLAEVMAVSFKDYLNRLEPYMSNDMVKELVEMGFEFGGHSIDHPFYHDLVELDQLLQTTESTFEIAGEFEQKHKLFSFPFSDYGVSISFFNRMKELEITTFGSAGLKDERFKLHYQRIPMEYKHNYSAKKIIRGELTYYIIKKIFNLNWINRN